MIHLLQEKIRPKAKETALRLSLIALAIIHAGTALGQQWSHPQQKLFGEQQTTVVIHPNPKAEITIINPNFAGQDFGEFKIPTKADFLLHPEQPAIQNLKTLFSFNTLLGDPSLPAMTFFVPPETARGVELPPSTHPVFRDILNKGTGQIAKFVANNQLRFSNLGFDGFFEVSEAYRDLFTSEILNLAGAWVPRGLLVEDHNHLVSRDGLSEPLRMGNYPRAFRVQTRLSNLEALTPAERKLAIDDAIEVLRVLNGAEHPMNYVEYYLFMTRRLAKTIAIFQAIGFTQDSLHYGQITLAGEIGDLGVGTFMKPAPGQVNTKYPWFRYERQPVLIQNMLYRTHSVKSEPEPVLLAPTSNTVVNQSSLFGYIKSFDPEAASQIEHMDPAKVFWNEYREFYNAIPGEKLRQELVSKYNEFFEWDVAPLLGKIGDEATRQKVSSSYQSLVGGKMEGMGHQGRFGPNALPAILKKKLFLEAVAESGLNPQMFATEITAGTDGPWNAIERGKYFDPAQRNIVPDISWIPKNPSAFHESKFGPEPLQALVNPNQKSIGPGRKILLPVNNDLSPFAVVRSASIMSVTVSYIEPRTGIVKTGEFSRQMIEKVNPSGGSGFGTGAEVAKIRIQPDAAMLQKEKTLREAWEKIKADLDLTLSQKQDRFLQVFNNVSYIANDRELSPEDREIYIEKMKARLKSDVPTNLENVFYKGCGNCMDQTVALGALLDRLAATIQIEYTAYSVPLEDGMHHWFMVITKKPSMEQVVFEPHMTAPRIMSIDEANYYPYADYGFETKAILPTNRPKLESVGTVCAKEWAGVKLLPAPVTP